MPALKRAQKAMRMVYITPLTALGEEIHVRTHSQWQKAEEVGARALLEKSMTRQ